MLIDFGYLLGLAFSIFMIVITILTWRNTETIKKNKESFGESSATTSAACEEHTDETTCTNAHDCYWYTDGPPQRPNFCSPFAPN